MKKHFDILILSLVVIVIFLMSVGYAVLNRELNISGEITYRPKADIRITNVVLENASNTEELYSSNFSKKEIKLGFNFISTDSSITYEIEVTNFTNIPMGILKIDGLPTNYEIGGYTLKTKLVNGEVGAVKKFTITFKPTNIGENQLTLKFDFEPIYKITYKNISGTYQNEIIKTDNLNVTFTGNKPEKVIVTMNNVRVTNFTYSNGNLSLLNVNGDIIIERDGPNVPVLSEKMLPVYYDEKEATWKKADVDNNDYSWYNYDEQKWANAVTVKESGTKNRSYYLSASVGTSINMDDINTMWVWIPRYSYTIKKEDDSSGYYGKKEAGRTTTPTQALPGEIDVKFIPSYTTDSGLAQYAGSSTPSEWFTPPGFTFGDKELPGLWVGKFETGTINNDSPGDVITDNLVSIKPNITNWRQIRVSSLQLVSMGITKLGNIYGFDQTTFDAHASKNIEWALISYFTQSKYGKYGNKLYSGVDKEIYINNYCGTSGSYSGYLTGCSSGETAAAAASNCIYQYNDLTNRGSGKGYAGAGASTTGNVYGIYDISGGAFEYVMGNYTPEGVRQSGNSLSYNSGYTGHTLLDDKYFTGRNWEDDKYYDFYSSDSLWIACDGYACKGHALSETYKWYNDIGGFLRKEYSTWMLRSNGCAREASSGVFAIDDNGGNAGDRYSTFRIILTPNM